MGFIKVCLIVFVFFHNGYFFPRHGKSYIDNVSAASFLLYPKLPELVHLKYMLIFDECFSAKMLDCNQSCNTGFTNRVKRSVII